MGRRQATIDPADGESWPAFESAASPAAPRQVSRAVSSVVEPPTFNRLVVGPNPTRPSNSFLRAREDRITTRLSRANHRYAEAVTKHKKRLDLTPA